MIRKVLFSVFFVSILAATGNAAGSENAAIAPSYFEGIWVGSWGGYYDPAIRQDVTLAIEKGGGEGVFNVDYSWGMVQFKNKTVYAGSLKGKGRQQGDQFFFQWKTRQGNENTITLQRESGNKVKARVDRGGTLPPGDRPYSETYLNRK